MKTKAQRPVKSGKVKKILLTILKVFVIVIASVCVLGTAATIITSSMNMKKIEEFQPVKSEETLTAQLDESGSWCFTTYRDLKILQLTDVHIGGGWMSYKKDLMALNAVAAMVTAEKPDLVVVTGDIAYPVPFQAGTFNNKTSVKLFAETMERLGVYWTVTFGNHDTEFYSYFSRKSISKLYENDKYEHCLFSAGPEEVDGYGNSVIKVKNPAGQITQALFCMDSHSYTDGDFLGIFWKYDNIHQNQIDWYKETVNGINEENKALGGSDVSSLLFIHIPLVEYRDAWNEYINNGYADTENVKLVYGGVGESDPYVYCGMGEDDMFEAMQEYGTIGVFCGHDHLNNFSLDYKGIRLTYGMSVDYLAYLGIYKQGAQRGCTVIYSSTDGSFECKAHNYYEDKYVPVFEKEEVTMEAAEN